MAALFIDSTDDLVAPWTHVAQPGDPAIAVNICPGQPADLPALIGDHTTVVVDHTYFDAAALSRCTTLKHIVFLGTGASSFIDLDAAASHGIQVHTIKGYGDTTVAEHTIALVMAAAREVARMDREVRAGQWRQHEGIQLLGKSLGIVGMGGIGKEVARIGAGIGMSVRAWNRSPLDLPIMAPLDDVMAADVVCICLALNDATRGFIGTARLAHLQPGAIFVNTARADIVDNHALAAMLQDGRLRHAAMDVFTPEPPAADSPFLGLPNVTLTAHAGFMTPEATMTMLRRAIDLVIRYD